MRNVKRNQSISWSFSTFDTPNGIHIHCCIRFQRKDNTLYRKLIMKDTGNLRTLRLHGTSKLKTQCNGQEES
jgi:hypothetical protein